MSYGTGITLNMPVADDIGERLARALAALTR